MTKEQLKIVFFGTPEFAVGSLRRLADGGFNIAGVVTMPDKPAGRGKHLLQSDVKRFALERGLNVLQPANLKDEAFVADLRALDADLFIVIAFRMLPEVVWAMPRLGTFNLHASLLPKYRGAAPINWAVINGETQTGVTTFFLKHEIDTGDIIQQKKIDIAPDENVGSVHDRLMELGASMVVETVEDIIAGKVATVSQDKLIAEGQSTTPAPKINKETCHISWNRPAQEVYNLIRGMSPYPAAWSVLTDDDGQQWQTKIYEARLCPAATSSPGTVSVDGKRMTVQCADAPIEIVSLQMAGKRRMGAQEFLRGLRYNGQLYFK